MAYIQNNEKEWVIKIPHAGALKEDFDIELTNGILTISGKENDFAYRFEKQYKVIDGVKASDISASYKDGLLIITINKPEGLSSKIAVN